MAPTQIPASASGRMRGKIDRGAMGDKVDFPDPAAAPLGTDDEAAGEVSNPAAVEASAHRQQALHADRLPKIEENQETMKAPIWPYLAYGAAAVAAAAFLFFVYG